MTDEELKALVASLAIAQQKTDIQISELVEQQKKTDVQLAKTDAQLAKTDAKVNKVADLVGKIGNNQGDVAEEFFYRSFIDDAWLGNLHFDTIYRNLPGKKAKLQDEFDIVLVNENSVAIIEVKQKARPDVINDMLNRKLPNFRKLFPYHKHQKLYGAIASLVSNDSLVKKARKAGLFFLTQKADHIVLVNDEVRAF